MTRNVDNELHLIDRRWVHDDQAHQWVSRHNDVIMPDCAVAGIPHKYFKNVVFLLERGFQAIAKRAYRRADVVIRLAEIEEMDYEDFKRHVRKQQNKHAKK